MALPLILARAAAAVSRVATKAKAAIQSGSKAKRAVEAGTTKQRVEAAKTFEKQRIQAKKSLSGVTRSEVASSNKLFQKELANAVRGRPSVLGRKGREKVQTFYRSTQNIWRGEAPENRNQAIMDYFNTDSLYQAYLHVMSKQKDVFKPDEDLTSTEQTDFYNEDTPKEETDGTPITVFIFGVGYTEITIQKGQTYREAYEAQIR